MKKLILAVLLLLGLCSSASATTYYVCDTEVDCDGGAGACGVANSWIQGTDTVADPANDGKSCGDPWRTIDYALNHITAGDTVVIGKGTYAGASNMINPPDNLNGTALLPITIQPETDGEVNINGAGARIPIHLYKNSYWVITGFNVYDSSAEVVYVQGSSANYNEIKRVIAWTAAAGAYNTYQAYGAQHTLFEDCAGWGRARKIFSASQAGDYTTFRRCFAMWNQYTVSGGKQPVSGMEPQYNNHDSTIENCIVTWDEIACTPDGSGNPCARRGHIGDTNVTGYNNKLYGNITFSIPGQNFTAPYHYFVNGLDFTVQDNVAIYFPGINAVGKYGFFLEEYAGGCTATTGGDTDGPGQTWTGRNLTSIGAGIANKAYCGDIISVRDAVVIDASGDGQYGFYDSSRVDYVLGWNNDTNWSAAPTHSYTNQPLFLSEAGNYLVAHDVTALAGKGETGGDIGANIKYRYINGVLQDGQDGRPGPTALWPWPMNDRIEAALTASNYSFTTSSQGVNGPKSIDDLLWGTASAPSVGPYYLSATGTAATLAAAKGGCGGAATGMMDVATFNGAGIGDSLLPGDIVYLCDDGGTYAVGIDVEASGDDTGNISFIAYDGENIVFDCGSADQPIYSSGQSHITISGNHAGGATWLMRDSMDAGIECTGCSDWHIQGITIGQAGDINEEEGILFDAMAAGKSFGVITLNTITANGLQNIKIVAAAGTDASGGTISYNSITNSAAQEGIEVINADEVNIFYNNILGNAQAAIAITGTNAADGCYNTFVGWNYIDQSSSGADDDGIRYYWSNGVIHGNIVTGAADAAPDFWGISVSELHGGTTYVYNNTTYNLKHGLYMDHGGVATGAAVFYNNIVQLTTDDAIFIDADAVAAALATVDYNIVYDQTNGAIQWGADQYNTLVLFTAAVPAQCVHCYDTDPLFTAAATGNFTLGAASDAINNGLALTGNYEYIFDSADTTWIFTLAQQSNYELPEIGAYVYPDVARYPSTYYVDATEGDDLLDGLTEATAWKTIAKVNGELLIPGDGVLFQRGETWAETLTVPYSGTEGKPIYFGAYGTGADPIITGDTDADNVGNNNYCITGGEKDYITIDGIECNYALVAGIYDDQGESWTIQNCTIHDFGTAGTTTGSGILIHGKSDGSDNCNDILIDNNSFGLCSGSDTGSVEKASINLHGVNDSSITNNYIESDNARGIVVYNSAGAAVGKSDNVTVSNNEITGTDCGISLTETINSEVKYNKIHDSNGWGIVNSYRALTNVIAYNVIYNLTARATQYNGIDINNTAAANAGEGVQVYNNTIYDCNTKMCITVEMNSDFTVVKNNILYNYGEDGFPIYWQKTGGGTPANACDNCTFSNNNYYRATSIAQIDSDNTNTLAEWVASSGETGAIDSDPLLAKPASGDMRLKKNSPCKDVGATITGAPEYCYCGNKVPIGACTDIGACEWKEETNIFKEILHGLGLYF